jgi:hypothetical protein
MKLKDVYIAWDKVDPKSDDMSTKLRVTAKALGVPDAENFFDPALWDQSNLAHLFLQWFTMITMVGEWDVLPVESPRDAYDELCKIAEFAKLMEGRILLKKKRADGVGEGDMETVLEALYA